MAKVVSSHYGQVAKRANTTPKQKKKKKKEKQTQRQTQKAVKKSRPSTPKKDVSKQYKEFKQSSFAPKTVKPKKKESSLQKAQKAFKAGQSARTSMAKRGVTNTSVVPKHSNNITDSFKVSKSDYKKAVNKGLHTTTLGTKQTNNTTTLKSKKEQKTEYNQQKTQYYKSKDWKKTKTQLKAQNKASWFNHLTKNEGMSAYDALAWMASDEGKKARKETYMASKDATKKAINDEIKKGIKDKSKLKSVNALTGQQFQQMETGTRLGKDLGNKYLESVGGKELLETIGSKTAESAYKSKLATGIMQGTSKADIFSGSVGRYNAGAKEAIEQTKGSGAYNIGYGIGLAGDMAMGGVASRGASLAEIAGKGAGKLSAKVLGKEAIKEVPTKALQEASEEIAKVSAKQGAKRFAQNRAGEFVAEAPVNVLDAVKMSLDADGNLDKKEFKKWLVINGGATFALGGLMEGVGAGVTRKLGNETLELMAKKEAGNITEEELAQLTKNAKKLSQKTKGNASMSSDIANKRLENINKRGAKLSKEKAEADAKKVPKGFHGGRRSRGQAEYTERAKQTAKRNEDARWNARVKKDIADTRARTPDRPTTIAEKREAKQMAKRHGENARRSAERSRNAEVRRLQDEIRTRREELAEAEARAKKKSNTVEGHAQAVRDVERLEKEIKAKESQLARASDDTLSGRIGKSEKALSKENTLQGHNKAVADRAKLDAELKADAKAVEKERKVEQALKEAKKRAEANPTEANNARVKMAEEALEKVKAEAKSAEDDINAWSVDRPIGRDFEANIKDLPSESTPKAEAKTPKAKTREEELKAEQDQLHKDGGKLYNKWIEARRSGVGEEEAEKAYKANQDRQREIGEELDALNGKTEAKAETKKEGGFASFTGKEAEDELERANLRSLSKEDSDIVGEVTKKSKEGTEVAVPKTRKLNEDGKSISAETGGTKKPLSLRFREMVSDNFASLEDIANKLPDKQRQAMLSAINEVRKASKTGRAMVAEKGRAIYSDFGLTKRGKKVAKKREEFEEVCFLEHELDRKKAGSSFTEKSREEIYERLHELKEKYATNVKRDSEGKIIFNKDGTTELLDANGKGTGKFADFKNWRVLNDGGELIPNTHLDDFLETELHNSKGTGFQDRTIQYFRDLLDREVDAGIITRTQALEHIKKFPHYVPSYRADKFDDILRNSTIDEINVGRGLKEAKGGSDRALVPLYNQMQVKTNMVVKRAELNKMLNLLATASGTTEKELDDLVPWFKNMDGEQKTEALMDAQYFTREAEGKHYAVMYRNGQEIKISLDKEVFDAVRRWSGEDRKNMTIARMFLEKAIDNKAIGWANSTFKKWITDYNLVFGLKNLGRDTATALFYTKDLKGFVKNMPKGFALSILPDSVGRKCMKNWDQYKKAYQVYKENGGIISQFIARDSASDTFFDSANKLNPFKWVENFNSALETMPRMTEFLSVIDAKAMKAGGDYDKAFEKILKNQDDIAEAMYRAKDVTLNFDRSGWLGAKLNRGIVPFFNPASQGISKLYRVMVRDNIKYGEKGIIAQKETLESFVKMGGYLVAMVVAPAMAFDAVPLPVKAEDGKHHTIGEYINGEVEGYEKQSDYNRYANYLIPIGDGKFLKIPRARELASLQSVLDYAYDNMMFGSGSKWDNLFKDRSVRDMKSLWETGIMAQIGPLTPWEDSLVAPIFRVRRNETWYGGKIESGTADAMHREAGEYSKIWDENTSRPAKYIGEKFNISPKKVDNVMDSYLGIVYDMGISQTSAKTDFLQVADENGGMLSIKGGVKGITSLTRSSWGRAFLIDSVFANANKSDYYNVANKRDKELSKLKEGTDEYNKVKAEIAKDKNAYSYTSCQYDELQANIWMDKNLTMSQKKKYARMLKQEDNSLWRDRKDGKTAPDKDPMGVAWNMKDGNGKRIMSTKTIIESCSYTNQKTGKNEIKDAYESYHALGGKSDRKFMEVTLSARDVQREAGDSLSSPRWEVVAYSSVLNKIGKNDKVLKAYIEKDKNRNHLIGNAQIYMDHDGSIKNYKVMRKALTQGVYDLGYDYVNEARDGEATMILANARTKKGKQYRDLAYQANDWYIMDRMNAGRCLDAKKNGHYQAKDIKHLCDKYKLDHDDNYKWDYDKVISAINKEHPKASNEVKSAMFVVITGKMDGNPFGEIGDYSLGNDTGVYCEGNHGWYHRRGRRRRGGWGHGGGGGRGSSFTPEVNTAGSKSKVTNTSKKKSNLDDAYRKKLKKLREGTRAK